MEGSAPGSGYRAGLSDLPAPHHAFSPRPGTSRENHFASSQYFDEPRQLNCLILFLNLDEFGPY